MAKVTGIGGVFFKCRDLETTRTWYRDMLGITMKESEGASFAFRDDNDPARRSFAVLGPFAADSEYFDPSNQPFMVNLRVDDLDGMLQRLTANGAQIVGETESYDFGRFAWVIDPDGVKLELWEPGDCLPPEVN